MKNLKMLTMVLALVGGLAVLAQAQTKNPIEDAVLRLEHDWEVALIKADTAALEMLCADTLVYTHSSGAVDDKAKYLASVKSGATKYLSFDRDDIKVTVYGDAAIVTCHVLVKLQANGEDRTVNGRMIRVYAKQKGRWQIVAHQITKLA